MKKPTRARRKRSRRASTRPAEQLSATEMGERLGMARQTINRLVREERLVHVPGSRFFDPAEPTNAKFIAEHARAASVSLPVSAGAGPLPAAPVPELTRSELERRKAAEQLRKLELGNQRTAGTLIERAFVFAFVGNLVAVLNNELLSIAQRTAPALAAIARGAESDDAAAISLEAELGKELYSAVRSASAQTRRFVRQMYGESAGSAGPLDAETALLQVRELLDRAIEGVGKGEAA